MPASAQITDTTDAQIVTEKKLRQKLVEGKYPEDIIDIALAYVKSYGYIDDEAYARDYMIDKGFTYCIPPFMIRSDVVTGVMSFPEMEAMMYKIQDEDLYLIGTSELSMIGRYKYQIIKEEDLPIT